jgi:serine protease Do
MENVNLTVPGQVMGTPTYMAPEQIVGEEVNAASDIYSLGVVAYEMLAGSPPFHGAMTSIFDGHVRREPPALRLLNPNLPEGLEPILRRVLSKNPQERFPTAASFANSLRQLFTSVHPATIATPPPFALSADSGGRSAPPSQPPAASTPSQPPAKKKGANLLLIFGALGALLLVCFCLAVALISWGAAGNAEPTAVAQATLVPTDIPDDPVTPPPIDDIDDDEPDEPPVDDGRVTSLEEARRAVVQIEAQGSFVDPQFGLQLNQAGRGSGFVIDSSGLAVTNNHVVTGAALLRVYVDGESRPRSARVLGVSECYDLAVIQIDGDPLPALSWYEDAVTEGLSVHAAGFPLGEPDYTLTSGLILSADADGVTDWAALDFVLAHSAPIQPGNSGGPLLADDGRLIGVNYALASGREEYFAIGRQQVLPIIEQLRQGQDIFAIGINGVAVNDGGDIAGIWVSSVKAGSPADQAGVLPGDIITAMQGLLLAQDGTMGDYCGVLRSHGQADVLSLEVLRLDTDEILAGQINGRPLETKSLLTNLDQTVGEGGQVYENYISFTDREEIIQVDIPAAWDDIGQGPWTRDDEPVGLYMVASADREGFYDRWDEPGIFLGASRLLITQYDENSFLDSFVYTNSCTYDDRYDYSDPLYTGYYDLWVEMRRRRYSLLCPGRRPRRSLLFNFGPGHSGYGRRY